MNSKVNAYPLFKHWYTTLSWILDRTETLPRSVRHTLAKRMEDHALDVMDLIVDAIFSPAKIRRGKLRRINLHLDKLRILIRLCHDRRYLSTKQYAYAAELINEAGMMCGGWCGVCEQNTLRAA